MPMSSDSRTPLLIRHHGLRQVEEQDILNATGGLANSPRLPVSVEIDTRAYEAEITSGGWDLSHGYIWKRAGELRDQLKTRDFRPIYAGMPEVPHALALGAYLGDQWTLEIYDFHRDTGSWAWPSTVQTLELEVLDLPREYLRSSGPAVIRIELSATIEDATVREFVSEKQETASVRIRPNGRTPSIAEMVRSPGDVAEVRRAVRHAISSLLEVRPNVTMLHLFAAAPVSALIVSGQELRPNNNPPVQTYRYRQAESSGAATPAILISAAGPRTVDLPLTEGEEMRAAFLRVHAWEAALRQVEEYAETKRANAGEGDRWYDKLQPPTELGRLHPFPTLAPIEKMIPSRSTVETRSFEPAFYAYDRDVNRWRVNDRFLLALDRCYSGQLPKIMQIIRLFMFHEALHVHHGITKSKVEEVGKFANGLEHVDFSADLYAILHEFDRMGLDNPQVLESASEMRSSIAALIDLVVLSFWAFEPLAPLTRMEVRRIRRYLNWYWQQIRVLRSNSVLQLFASLVRKPIIELAGLEHQASSRRHYASLHRFDSGVGLELGIVLDDEELWRIPTSATVPLRELVAAFSNQDHEGIRQIFRAIFDHAEGSKNPLPDEGDLFE